MSGIIVGAPTALNPSATFQTLTGTATASAILMNTADAADNASILIGVASNAAAGRGAHIQLYGNENGELGGLYLRSGNAVGGILGLYTGGSLRWQIANANGDLSQNATNGGQIVFNKANSTINFNGTMGDSTKAPQTVAPDDWVEIQIAGVTRYLPAYAAS